MVRRLDRRLLRHLGYGRAPAVALPAAAWRPPAAVLDRALALSVVLAVVGGMEATTAAALLDGLDVREALEPDEAEYLDDVADGIRLADALRATEAEALAALTWALGLGDLPPGEPHPVSTLPDPLPREPSLRPEPELDEARELYAAMVAALDLDPDLEVGHALGPYDPYVARQRHRALAWVAGGAW
jgi:hypothetical protein